MLFRSLQRTSVTSVMDSSLQILGPGLDPVTAAAWGEDPPRWLLTEGEDGRLLYRGEDIIRALGERTEETLESDINLADLDVDPVSYRDMSMQSTLREALDVLEEEDVSAIFVQGEYQSIGISIRGVVTMAQVTAFYRQQS